MHAGPSKLQQIARKRASAASGRTRRRNRNVRSLAPPPAGSDDRCRRSPADPAQWRDRPPGDDRRRRRTDVAIALATRHRRIGPPPPSRRRRCGIAAPAPRRSRRQVVAMRTPRVPGPELAEAVVVAAGRPRIACSAVIVTSCRMHRSLRMTVWCRGAVASARGLRGRAARAPAVGLDGRRRCLVLDDARRLPPAAEQLEPVRHQIEAKSVGDRLDDLFVLGILELDDPAAVDVDQMVIVWPCSLAS